jgi:hypothetical protein
VLKMYSVVFIVLTTIVMVSAEVTNVINLKWMDPYGRKPITYSVWEKGKCKEELTRIGRVYERGDGDRQNVVNVIVNSAIYPHIQTEMDTFVDDLLGAGYSVQLDTITGMSPAVLRNHLAGITDLVGAIFVGELPVAWFELNGFGSWEEFPHDLFFCDLNGSYYDDDADGIYDSHSGTVEPEIWVGRIYARNLTWGNEVHLLKKYFAKNHHYRASGSSLPERALAFVDDDWDYFGNCYLDTIYSNVVVIDDYYQTIASNYRTQLGQGYEWLHICAHSSPWGHTFKYGSSGFSGTVFNYEIFTLEPRALFYNLFACSGTRFVEENHSAGWYLFGDNYGLLAVGSTKTGSMLYFNDFYGPIGQQNLSIGEGFKSWFTMWGEYDRDWFYGLNILGDPTLKPKSQVRAVRDRSLRAKQSHITIGLSNFNTDWEQPEVVAGDPESDGFPAITVNTDGKVWINWESGRSVSNGRCEIYSSYRSGGSWSGAMVIGPSYYWDFCPDIGIDNLDRPVAVWAGWYDSYGNYQYDVFYSVYTTSWSTRQMVHSLDPGIDVNPTLIQDEQNKLWLSWESSRDTDRNIYVSSFDGSSWSTPQQVTSSSTDEVSPYMAVDSLGKVWVFYCKRGEESAEIWGSYYTGSSWMESGPISGTQKHAYKPSAGVDEDGNIWVAYHSTDNGNAHIFVNNFDGSDWSTPQQLTSSGENLFVDVTAENGGPLWLVFQSRIGDEWNIYSSYCIDSTWNTPQIVFEQSGPDINPQIVCSASDEVWLTWQNYTSGDWRILVSHRPGLSVNEQKERYSKKDFGVSSTLFSKRLEITTIKPNQEIRIYDVKGGLVRSLISDRGNKIVWFTENIPCGIYFIVLNHDNKIFCKKATLLK